MRNSLTFSPSRAQPALVSFRVPEPDAISSASSAKTSAFANFKSAGAKTRAFYHAFACAHDEPVVDFSRHVVPIMVPIPIFLLLAINLHSLYSIVSSSQPITPLPPSTGTEVGRANPDLTKSSA